jgi:hypothetical protein
MNAHGRTPKAGSALLWPSLAFGSLREACRLLSPYPFWNSAIVFSVTIMSPAARG